MHYRSHAAGKSRSLFLIFLLCIAFISLIAACGQGGGSGGSDDPEPQNNPPQAALTANPTSGNAPLVVDFDAAGCSDPDGDTLTYAWDFGDGTTLSGQEQPSHTYTAAGNFSASLTVTDMKGSSDSSSISITVNPSSGTATVPDVVNQTQANATTAITNTGLTLGSVTTKNSDTIASGNVISQDPAAGTSVSPGTAVDLVVSLGIGSGLPPDPATVASAIDRTVVTNLADSVAFLYTSANPIQTGVAPGTIVAQRTAVLRGRVLDRDSSPLPGVKITVLDHDEFGQTLSREDGMFDLVVNGGGLLTATYELSGYLTAQRQVDTPWQDYIWLPDVVLVPLDTEVTTIDFSEPIQVARGSEVTDDDGTRRATLFCPQSTTAEMVLPDGSTQAISTLNIRATEYTVGDNGPAAMPAMLPPTSAYTYCVDLTVDEALAAGATSVTFSQPLYYYLENFINFPVGGIVPNGYYDSENDQWIAATNGRVIEFVNITAGLAELDIDGDGLADDDAELTVLGLTEDERRKLATLYSPGQTLWRIPITHFSPLDYNWAFFAMPPDAAPPNTPPPGRRRRKRNRPCNNENRCIIEYQNQSLRERVPVAGNSFSLYYRNERVVGFKAGNTLDISLSGDSIPASLKRIDLEIYVAGAHAAAESFPPSTNLDYRYIWDGIDAYGRNLQGEQHATVKIGYVYDGTYGTPFSITDKSFGSYPGDSISLNQFRDEVILWREHKTSVGIWEVIGQGLGGWTIDVHHTYDPISKTLYLGDGTRQKGESMTAILKTNYIYGSPDGIAVGPDGSLYFFMGGHNLYRMDTEGATTIIAGENGSNGFGGDGGPAEDASFYSPQGIDIAPDGRIYIADTNNNRIRMIDTDGIIHTVAGNGSVGIEGDGGPATEASLAYPNDVVAAPNGGYYISQIRYSTYNAIRYVSPDGIISSIAGKDGVAGVPGDGGPALEAYIEPYAIDVGPDGSIYIVDNSRIRKITPDGIINTTAGNGEWGFSGDGGPAVDALISTYSGSSGIHVAGNGSVYFTDSGNHRMRMIDPQGIIHTIAGTGRDGYPGNNLPATATSLGRPSDCVVDQKGDIHFTDYTTGALCTLTTPSPSFSSTEQMLVSRDGREAYIFDLYGRHLRTVDALTGALRFTFGYDEKLLLVTITDADDQVTTVERDADGNPTAVVGPYNHRTEIALDGDGYIQSVTDPLGGNWTMGYSNAGLLTSFDDPNSTTLTYTYDEAGMLIRDDDPESGYLELDPYDIDYGYEVSVMTSENRTTTYRVETLDDGTLRRTTVFPDGMQNVVETGTDGTSTFIAADGTQSVSQTRPDPRFGMGAPIIASYTETTPGGLSFEYTQTKTATLNSEQDLLQPESIRNNQLINGLFQTVIYDKDDASITLTTPENRRMVSILDDLGRFVEYRYAGLTPIYHTYDGQGRISEISHGTGVSSRTYTKTYGSLGALEQIINPLGLVFDFSTDLLGRITALTRPEGDTVQWSYDGRGNLTGITTPKGFTHTFTYNQVNNITSYDPPDAIGSTAPTVFTYNLDRQLTSATNGGDRTVEFTYDAGGRLESMSLERGTVQYQYDASTGKLNSVTAPDSGYALEYDGKLVTGTIWSGDVSGRVDLAYNNFFRVSSCSVNSGDAIDLEYDDDGLLTRVGDLVLTLDNSTGFVTATDLTNVSDTFVYNDFGDMTGYSCAFDGTGVYTAALTRDHLGRVMQKEETRHAAATDTYVYTYDDNGRLEGVTKNSVTTHSYGYDLNDNRVSYTGPDGVPISASYDDQDRLLSFGTTTHTYRADGSLTSKTFGGNTTTFNYDELGNLIAVTLDDNTEITYLIDGRNRRIGKKVNGALVQGFLYQNSTNPIAELDGTGNIVGLFVYGTKSNVPDYMVKSGQTYRIISDQLGSPLMVVNTATGDIVQEIEYDAFGSPTFVSGDTNFQPFGFAGGLYDIHTGLVRFGARDYDPSAGRFTAKDPILFEGGTVNLYAYLGNDPLNLVDPNGMGGSNDCDDDDGDCNGRSDDQGDDDQGDEDGRWDNNDDDAWQASELSWEIPYWADSVLGFSGALVGAAHYMSSTVTTALSGVGAALQIIAWPVAMEAALQTGDQLGESLITEPNRQIREAIDNMQPDGPRNPRDDFRDNEPCP